MSKQVSVCAVIAIIVLCAELRADTINQSSGMSTVTISVFDPIGQTFQWTTDEFLGSIGFTFNTQNPSVKPADNGNAVHGRGIQWDRVGKCYADSASRFAWSYATGISD
jgi:hypothetical protein